MKKWMIFIMLALFAVGGGVWGTEHFIRKNMANQVITMLGNSTLSGQINQINQDSSTANHVGTTKSSSSVGAGSGGSTGLPAGNSSTQSNLNSQSLVTQTPSPSQSALVFTSRNQVVQYAMSHFTQSEINQYTYLYLHRSTLTKSEKEAIKAQILSHFSPQELQAMFTALHQSSR